MSDTSVLYNPQEAILDTTTAILLRLQEVLLETLDYKEVVQRIVNELFHQTSFQKRGYRIIVLTLVDETKGVLQRISLSETPEAAKTLQVSAVPFKQIDIPLDADENVLIQALKRQRPMITHDWAELFTPILTPEQAHANQNAADIKTSIIFPIIVKKRAIGVLIFSLSIFVSDIPLDEKQILESFAGLVGIAVQNSQLFTRLSQTTETLQKANIQIGLTNKLKEDLLVMASHEFRTPVSIINNALWFLTKDEVRQKLTERERENLNRIVVTMERLNYIVENINQMLQVTNGELTLHALPVQLEILIKEVIEAKELEATDKNIVFHYNESLRLLPLIIADKVKLKYVIWELITNALKYTPQGGSVTITTTEKEHAIQVVIADTGVGIKPEVLSHLFEVFGKADVLHTTQPGMGLGLYIVKQIISLHEGTITANSQENNGTSMTITLPIHPYSELRQSS